MNPQSEKVPTVSQNAHPAIYFDPEGRFFTDFAGENTDFSHKKMRLMTQAAPLKKVLRTTISVNQTAIIGRAKNRKQTL
jgi:hypothetical protein